LAAEPVDLLLFAGGDGTARNIHNTLGEDTTLTVIGIPAGVKIHSAVYATTPQSAGELARQYLQEGGLPLRQAEVMDIDEEAFREGRLSASLYGYLPVPCNTNLMQHLKVGGAATETSTLEAIAEQVVENMQAGITYIIGPGSTLSPIMEKLGFKNTLLGVDVVKDGKLFAADVGEKKLLKMIRGQEAKIIVTVIGGQGYIFGRGNQQISTAVIRQVGRENIIVVATKEKILALEHGSLLVDSGDEEVNTMLRGYIRVITGYREELICKVR
jgi:predicted polyphosphate/ATP-dependent NAD kinase